MKRFIYVNIEDYKKYIEEYNNNRIDRNHIIVTNDSALPKFIRSINEEIFEGISTDYEFLENLSNKKLIKFTSKSNVDYRLDLLKESDSDIWHIAFSEFDKQLDNNLEYELQTNKQESIDVFSRIVWILKDINMDVEYCIGYSSDQRKNNIYMYMMKFVSNWEKEILVIMMVVGEFILKYKYQFHKS